jgi:hypothetical protein
MIAPAAADSRADDTASAFVTCASDVSTDRESCGADYLPDEAGRASDCSLRDRLRSAPPDGSDVRRIRGATLYVPGHSRVRPADSTPPRGARERAKAAWRRTFPKSHGKCLVPMFTNTQLANCTYRRL